MYCTHLMSQVRQAACYGLGILAEHTPIMLRKPDNAICWIEELKLALGVMNNSHRNVSSYRYCRDNIVAAIGKIMRTHMHLIDIQPYL